MATDRAVSALERRLGANVTIEDASLRWSGVVFEDLRIEGEEGGLSIHAGEVGVRGGLWAMANEGASAVEYVQVRELSVEVDLANGGAESMRSLVNRTRSDSDAQSQSGAAANPSSRVAEATGRVLVQDEDGHLASSRFEMRYEGGELRGSGTEGEIGVAPSDVMEAERWSVLIRGRQIAEVESDNVALQVGSESGTTLRRLRDALDRIRQSGEQTETQENQEVPGWMARLADGAVVRVGDFSAKREGRDLLEGLSTTITRANTELHLEGEGGVQGGQAAWDLWVAPSEAKGRGTLRASGLPFDLFLPFLPELPWWRPEQGRVDADLTMRAEELGQIAIDGSAAVTDIGLSSPRIAPSPVAGLGMEFEGKAVWFASERRLAIEEAKLRRGQAEVNLQGDLERTSEHYRASLQATMPATNCNAVVGALPRALLADAGDFEWEGRLGGRLTFEVDSRNLDDTELRIRMANACEFLSVPITADLRRVRAPFIHRVLEPDGTTFEMTAGPGSPNWSPVVSMSPFLVQAIVGHEDAGFFRHSGFAVYAIRDSLVRNLEEGRYVTGASTITMQLAKNLFLHREKTIARKLQEVILTWWLESALSKEEILELYLNVIEYGPGIYGIVNAAEHYFGREPSELSPAESAFLACVLPNPKAYHESYERGTLTRRMRNRVERFLRHQHSRNRIDEEALNFAIQELQDFRFARPGEHPGERQVPGSTAPLPWSTGRMSDWGPEEDPYGESFGDSEEGSEGT
ncbi:MAG: biosynthetic peptidoglycan transglycosylase [Myxococcota bacterium]